jgi:hypothetical protein
MCMARFRSPRGIDTPILEHRPSNSRCAGTVDHIISQFPVERAGYWAAKADIRVALQVKALSENKSSYNKLKYK